MNVRIEVGAPIDLCASSQSVGKQATTTRCFCYAVNESLNRRKSTLVTDTTRSESQIPTPASPSFGWNVYAEQINGRFAMIGFVLLLGIEFFTGQDLWTWLGLR